MWVKCPVHWDSEALWSIARNNHKVQFQPGFRFSATKQLRNYLRLSISYYDKDEMEEGARRLGAAVREYAQVVGEKTPATAEEAAAAGPRAVRVAVHGATGKLGSLIVNLLTQPNKEGLVYAGAVPREGDIPPCDVIIDVSTAEGAKSLVPRLTIQKLVVGTTGELPYKEYVQYSATNPVVIVPNFSAGVPLLHNLVKSSMEQLPSGWNTEIVEVHHTAKRDAPSGTAKRLAEPLGNIPIHSLRIGDTVGEHTVYFAGPGERIELKHTATKREVFAIGALRIAKWVHTQNPGLYHK